MKPRKPFERERHSTDFDYNSRAWRALAKEHKQENPFCVMCEAEGVVKAVEYTDHIVRIKDGGAPMDKANLQSLCKHHHNAKSGRETHY